MGTKAPAVGGGERAGEGGELGKKRGTGLPPGPGAQQGGVVSGVSTLVDLPLPNNGDYCRE